MKEKERMMKRMEEESFKVSQDLTWNYKVYKNWNLTWLDLHFVGNKQERKWQKRKHSEYTKNEEELIKNTILQLQASKKFLWFDFFIL